MREVAKSANVSIGTVSRVLNRYDDVAPDLKERVEAAVRQLGYKLNGRTRAVVRSKSSIIGLLLCNDFGLDSTESLVLLGVEEYCAKAGYYLLFARHHSPSHVAPDVLQRPNIIETPGLADCFILVGSVHCNLLEAFDLYGLDYVTLANHVRDVGHEPSKNNSVRYDDEGGCFEATRYLAQLGHTAIWYVGDESRSWHRNRYRGYCRAMEDLNLQPHAHAIALSDDEFENGQAAVSYMAEQQWPATAILAASDELAYGVREGLRQHRREVPKDVSVIGLEHRVEHARASNLTSVVINMVEVGRRLAQVAIAQIEGSGTIAQDVVVPAQFLKRSTCRPLRKEEHMLL
jgi:DNA-binding LacI/PurR family transcriptional regulator